MSAAWAQLVNNATSDAELELFKEALAELQAEIRRRFAAKLQAENPDRCADFSEGVDWATEILREGL